MSFHPTARLRLAAGELDRWAERKRRSMRNAQELRCLLISPSDVAAERDAVAEVVTSWNAQIGRALGARVELVRWETHSTPDLSAPPQQVLNEQLLEGCDFAIAIFWSRIGTPTAEYASGSDEEIRRLLGAGVRVLIYFSRSPIPQGALRTDQYARLQKLRDELEPLGLLGFYESVPHLREQVQLHITSVASDLLGAAINTPGPSALQHVLTASLPDLRVSSSAGFAAFRGLPPQDTLSINVANHSPVPVYIAAIQVELDDGSNLFPRIDSVTNELNGRRTLQPGDGFDFHLVPDDVLSVITDPALMKRAMVRDAIGRVYYSDEDSFRHNVRLVFRSHARRS
jgi:hypothetical protein